MKQPNNNRETRRAARTTKRPPLIRGPVSNLEEHVQADWWRNIFNSLYLKTDADVVDDPAITRDEVTLFSQILELKPEMRILDLCCGQGRHTIALARQGYTVEGLDRSRYLIQRARATARKEGLSVSFKEGDARNLPFPPDTFDAVMILGNSFGYFETPEDDLRVLREVVRILKPWGRILLDVTDGEYLKANFLPRSWEWISKKLFVCRERSLSSDTSRLISREVVTDVGKGVIADQFYAERLYSSKELQLLLMETGFSDAAIHGELSPDSQRKQDLGMMERRIIITGVIRKEWTESKRRPRGKTRPVVVLFGDPQKPDRLKPDAIFDDDDFYTIDQMKAALRNLKEYDVSYLTDHTSLIADLAALKNDGILIFNLCDEGYNNDPRKELHLPALLEMLQMPYTGSTPQCLAFCYDKSLVRGVAKEMGLPVPAAFFIEPEDMTFELPVNFPVIVKPNYGDSSFGITRQSVCESHEDLINAIIWIREKLGYDKPILVEEFLPGKDLSVGIIGNVPNAYTVLPVIEEDYSRLPADLPRICGYEAKWDPASPYASVTSIKADLPPEIEKGMVECCLKLFDRLECRDYCRFDWRQDARGNPKLLEVNPNPGWCWDGHLAKMAAFAGISYPEMVKMILAAAEQRIDAPGIRLAGS
jgi:D-alanine-D-alanine ligase